MINDEELIERVQTRVAYDNSQKEFNKKRSIRRKVVMTLCSLALVCALGVGVDAATDGAISAKFKQYFYTSEGVMEEMPLVVEKDENGRDVYKFTKTFTQDGHDLTFEGEYYENDGTFQFGDCVVLNEDGTVNNDIFVLNYVADSEEDAEEFQKMINEIPVDETESK